MFRWCCTASRFVNSFRRPDKSSAMLSTNTTPPAGTNNFIKSFKSDSVVRIWNRPMSFNLQIQLYLIIQIWFGCEIERCLFICKFSFTKRLKWFFFSFFWYFATRHTVSIHLPLRNFVFLEFHLPLTDIFRSYSKCYLYRLFQSTT